MTIVIRGARLDDLEAMAALAAEAQTDPERFCAYLGEESAAIADDIAAVAGPNGGDWTKGTWLALDDARNVVAWLLADVDADMGRVWWWGPIIADGAHLPIGLRDGTMDQLLSAGSNVLAGYPEHEFAADDRSTIMRSFAARHGFVAEEASAMLRTEPFVDTEWAGDGAVVELATHHHVSVAKLHDELFPGTHTTGEKLVEPTPGHEVLVIAGDRSANDDDVIGYVAVETQSDGSLYIDFLGVAVSWRGHGFGRRLISEAMRRGAAGGASHAHLTVRAGNTAARRLYASLGFLEDSLLLPLRKGFTIP